jgi:lipid A 3-O-deacylase
MRQFSFTFFLINFFLIPLSHAADRVDFCVGNITRPANTIPIINSFRAGATWYTDHLEFENDFLQQSLRIEASVGLNRSKTGDVRDMVLAPVLHYKFKKIAGEPFFEISSGAAYISETLWAPYHDLSSRRLFADRIGGGYSIGKVEISLNYFHFSNAGLHRPNPGADMVLIRTSFKL